MFRAISKCSDFVYCSLSSAHHMSWLFSLNSDVEVKEQEKKARRVARITKSHLFVWVEAWISTNTHTNPHFKWKNTAVLLVIIVTLITQGWHWITVKCCRCGCWQIDSFLSLFFLFLFLTHRGNSKLMSIGRENIRIAQENNKKYKSE